MQPTFDFSDQPEYGDKREVPPWKKIKPTGFPRPQITQLDEFEERPVTWLWPGVAALGKLTLIAGEPGVGKSLVTLDMAARVTRGKPFPGCADAGEPGGVVLLCDEDGIADTIRPRLAAADARLGAITMLRGVRQKHQVFDPLFESLAAASISDPVDLWRHPLALDTTIKGVKNCRLVVIDPLPAFLLMGGGAGIRQSRRALAYLSGIAAKRQVAIVAVSHFTKSANDPLMYRPVGGIGALTVARIAWSVVREQDSDRRWMTPLKQNLSAPSPSLAFTVMTDANGRPKIDWEESLAGTSPPDQPPAAQDTVTLTEELPPDADHDCRRHLTKLIHEHGGQITVRILMRTAPRQFRNSAEAKTALAELVAAGLARCHRQPRSDRGGRVTEVFSVGEGI